MTTFSWFSGNSDPSRKFMVWSLLRSGGGSIREVADDPGAFHLAVAGRVVHHRVVLGGPVVPHRHRVLLPAPAHLVLGDEGLADEVAQQLPGAGVVVLPEAHVLGRVVVAEVRREGIDEEDLLA